MRGPDQANFTSRDLADIDPRAAKAVSQVDREQHRAAEKQDPKVHLLRDEPVLDDQIGGTHNRTAEAIAKMIQREPQGGSIALEGSYGSGKSSIIRMVKDRLARADQDEDHPRTYQVMTFDAWHHEGEALQLAFLHTLVDELARRQWLAGPRLDMWRAEMAILEGRRKVEVTASRPIGSRTQAMALMLLAAGVGGWSIKDLLTELLKWLGLKSQWTSDVILLLCTAAVITAVWLFFRAGEELIAQERRQSSIDPDEDGSTVQRDPLSSRAEALAVGRGGQQVRSTTSGGGTISSRTFEDRFVRLMENAFHPARPVRLDADCKVISEPRRVLVIVMDNLDRLDPQEAMRVWNTLRVFSEFTEAHLGRSADAIDALRRIWLLAPFDRKKLLNGKDDAAGVALLDKVFHARFDVPAPRLVNWRDYFRKLLAKAIPDVYQLDRDDAVNVIEAHFEDENLSRPPTPRELIIITNDIGALVRTYNTQFSLAALATFVALRRRGRSIEMIRESLMKPDALKWLDTFSIPGGSSTFLGNLEEELRGLTLGTSTPAETGELELEREFFHALNGARVKQIRRLVELPAFWEWIKTRTHTYGEQQTFDFWRSIHAMLEALREPAPLQLGGGQRRSIGDLIKALLRVKIDRGAIPDQAHVISVLEWFAENDELCGPLVERQLLRSLVDEDDATIGLIVAVVKRAEALNVMRQDLPISVNVQAPDFVKLAVALHSAGERAKWLLSQIVPAHESPLAAENILTAALLTRERYRAVAAVSDSLIGRKRFGQIPEQYVTRTMENIREAQSANATGTFTDPLLLRVELHATMEAFMLIPGLRQKAELVREDWDLAEIDWLRLFQRSSSSRGFAHAYALIEHIINAAPPLQSDLPAEGRGVNPLSALLKSIGPQNLLDLCRGMTGVDHPAVTDGRLAEAILGMPDDQIHMIIMLLGLEQDDPAKWVRFPASLRSRIDARLKHLVELAPRVKPWAEQHTNPSLG